jgi:heat shock protein HslJ
MKTKFGLAIWILMLALVLMSCIGDSGTQLDGTSWRLVSYSGKAVILSSSPTLIFDDGNVGGNASCNTFGGNYRVSGSRLEIGETFSTLMACVDNDLMAQEQEYFQMLSEVSDFELDNGRLVLTTEGNQTLIFVPLD